jgi:hypothetical protein
MKDIRRLYRNPRIRGIWIYLSTREANTKDLVELSGYTEHWLHNGVLKKMLKANLIVKEKQDDKFTLWKATVYGKDYLKLRGYILPELNYKQRQRLEEIENG